MHSDRGKPPSQARLQAVRGPGTAGAPQKRATGSMPIATRSQAPPSKGASPYPQQDPWQEEPSSSGTLMDRKQRAVALMRMASDRPKEELQSGFTLIAGALSREIFLIKRARADGPADGEKGESEPVSLHFLLTAAEHAARKGCDVRESLDDLSSLLDPSWSLFTRQSVVLLISQALDKSRSDGRDLNLSLIIERLSAMMLDPDPTVRLDTRTLLCRYVGIASNPADFRNASQLMSSLTTLERNRKDDLTALSASERRVVQEIADSCRSILDRQEREARRSLPPPSSEDRMPANPPDAPDAGLRGIDLRDLNVEGLIINLVRSKDRDAMIRASALLKEYSQDYARADEVFSFLSQTISAYPRRGEGHDLGQGMEKVRWNLIEELSRHCAFRIQCRK